LKEVTIAVKCRVYYRNPLRRWIEASIRYLDEVTQEHGLTKATENRVGAALLRNGTHTFRKGFKLQSIEYPNGKQNAAA
jgi:hypothetical protein